MVTVTRTTRTPIRSHLKTAAQPSTQTSNLSAAYTAAKGAAYTAWTGAGQPSDPNSAAAKAGRATAIATGVPAYFAAGGKGTAAQAAEIVGGAFDALVAGKLSGFESFASKVEIPGAGLFGEIYSKLLPILKIGAGGVIMLVSGIALVYVAGRKTPIGKAAESAAQFVPGGRVAAIAAGQRATAQAARSERVRGARERGRARVVTTESGGRSRVSVESRRSARRAMGAAASHAATPRSQRRAKAPTIAGTPYRRRRQPATHPRGGGDFE